MYDALFTDTNEDLDYDALTFEERDELDAAFDNITRELVYGLPARPGTRR